MAWIVGADLAAGGADSGGRRRARSRRGADRAAGRPGAGAVARIASVDLVELREIGAVAVAGSLP